MLRKKVKIYFCFTLVLIILSIISTNAIFIFADGQPVLSVGQASSYRGCKAKISINLSNIRNITGMQFVVKYDNNCLDVNENDIKIGSQISRWLYDVNIIKSLGEIRFACANNSFFSTNEVVTVLTVDFTILSKAQTGETTLTLDEIYAGDGFKNILVTKSYGFVSISDSIPNFIFGDISGDGHFDAGDYYLLKSYLLYKTTEFPYIYWKKAADVSGDGFINSSDYILMRSKILKIIPKFPVERG